MSKLESQYQTHVIERIEQMLPGCLILKNDSGYRQGIPDWSIFYRRYWAMLEIKRKTPTPSDFQPNQEWYIAELDKMSFCACIYPEVEEEVLGGLLQALRPRRQTLVSQS